jgi:hypothetical protein
MKIRACAFVIGGLFLGCASWGQVARTVLDIGQVTCILANAEMDNLHIRHACGLIDDLAPAVETVLKEHKRAASRERMAAGCKP